MFICYQRPVIRINIPLTWCPPFVGFMASSPLFESADSNIHISCSKGNPGSISTRKIPGRNPAQAIPSLKLTWHLKMDGWNTSFLLGWPIFRGYVSFRECNHMENFPLFYRRISYDILLNAGSVNHSHHVWDTQG